MKEVDKKTKLKIAKLIAEDIEGDFGKDEQIDYNKKDVLYYMEDVIASLKIKLTEKEKNEICDIVDDGFAHGKW